MFRNVFLTLSLLMLATSSLSAYACDQACKKDEIDSYLSHIVKIFVRGSTEADIDKFLNQLHDEVKYEHSEYGADFDKLKWREAFVHQLKLGSYTDEPTLDGRVLNIIYGKQHAAVEYTYGEVDSQGVWKAGHIKFALFGFKDGKISLIREYW